MLTRRSFQIPDKLSIDPQDVPGSLNKLAQAQYDFMRSVKTYLDDLNGKGALNITANSVYSDGGYRFPATQYAASDPNTLDDYEEGTWTPNDGSGATLTLTVNAAKYTKVGRLVVLYFDVTYPVTASGSSAVIGGIPFSEPDRAEGAVQNTVGATVCQVRNATAVFWTAAGALLTNANLSGATVRSTIPFMV